MRKYIEREHIRPKDYIFKGKDGGASRGTTFRQEFQQYCDKNGIADGSYIFKTHDYRHTLATQFYDEDVSIQTIRDYLGHFSEEMTKQYVDFMPRELKKQVIHTLRNRKMIWLLPLKLRSVVTENEKKNLHI